MLKIQAVAQMLQRSEPEVMKQPVRAQDGCAYEEMALRQYFNDLKSRGEPIVSPHKKTSTGESFPMEESYQKDSALALKIKNFVE